MLNRFKFYIFNKGIKSIEDMFFIIIGKVSDIIKAFKHSGIFKHILFFTLTE